MRGLAALALMAGCTSIFGLDSPRQRSHDAAVPGDDASPDAAPDAPLGPWGNIAQVIPSAGAFDADDDPSLTDDMLELYFNRGSSAIYVAKRADVSAPFGTATEVSEISAGGNANRPSVSGDGLLMIFSSSRAPSAGYDLWWTTRANRSSAWGTPMQLSTINSAADEVAGPQTEDGLEIVYAADRLVNDSEDLYFATRPNVTNSVFGQGTSLPFNTAQPETSPFLARDGQTLYFTIVSSTTMADIYVTHRMGNQWTTPEPVSELNDATPNSDPWVSPDEHHMFFANTVAGHFQIFEASR